jgi:disulfide bond formation protein DsbB
MTLPSPRAVLAGATALAAAALFTALASEWWGGLVPCPLCLVERWPYRAAIAIGLLGLALPRRFVPAASAAFALAMLAGAAAATVHVGVERGAWKSPLPECAGPNLAGLSIAQRLAAMPARPSKACEDPTYLVPGLKVSMAEMNLIFCLGLAGAVAASLALRRPARA